MQVNRRSVLDAILIGIISIFWCEFAYYYYVFYFSCPTWPGLGADSNSQDNVTKLLMIADTHIMGQFKSFKIDKWRREWQMKQAFSISTSIYKPDVVVFMGDLLDEGLTFYDALFEQSCKEFEEVFPPDNDVLRIIVPGNHDIGFHDRMIYFPFFMQRFQEKFNTTSTIDLIHTFGKKPLNLVVSNSMSLYNDSCPVCLNSLYELNQVKLRLDQTRVSDPSNYSPPIFLGHIPLYRKNDLNCIFPESMRSRSEKDNVEGKDVLHGASSRAIISKIQPRLAISGHTHMQCLTSHQAMNDFGEFQEITITSYNHKYAELEPGFLLLTADSDRYNFKHCNLINEMVVVSVYVSTLIAIVFRLVTGSRHTVINQPLSGSTG